MVLALSTLLLSTLLLIIGSAIVGSFAACFDKQADCSCCKSGECANPGDETYSCNGCIEGYTGHDCREPCPETCVNCSQNYFNGNRTCFACKNGFYNGKPEDISYHPLQNDCSLSCIKGCELCVSYTQCERCKVGFYMSKNKDFKGNPVCIRCQDHCRTCISDSSCTECDSGLFLEGSECKLCESGCISCNGSNNCNECHKGLYLDSGRCVPCTNGYWGKTCENKCTTGCRDNVCNSQNGSCIHGCQDNYIQNGDGHCAIIAKHVSVPLIVGLLVGALVLVTFFVIVYIFFRRRKTKNNPSRPHYKSVAQSDLDYQANSIVMNTLENGLGTHTDYSNSNPSEVQKNNEQFADDNSQDENDGLTQENVNIMDRPKKKVPLNVEHNAKCNSADGNDDLTQDKKQDYEHKMYCPESPKQDNSTGQHINEETSKHDDMSADNRVNRMNNNHSTTENDVTYKGQQSVQMQCLPETMMDENESELKDDETTNETLKKTIQQLEEHYDFLKDKKNIPGYAAQKRARRKTLDCLQKISSEDIPTTENKPTKVHVSKLQKYLKDKTSQDFKDEFKQTEPSKLNRKWPSKQVKLENPFRDIYLYAYHIEVINNYNEQDKYIAYSGKGSTSVLGVTWEMVWQNNVSIIVTLCKQNSTENYWSEIEQQYEKINMTVTCVGQRSNALYTIREFVVRKAGELERVVKQLHCTVWPMKELPSDTSVLGIIQQEVSNIKSTFSRPTCTLVHSSNDLCHAGLFIAFDNLTKECSAEDSVDVVSCVRKLRQQTSSMIREKQYEYLYRAIAHACTFKNTP